MAGDQHTIEIQLHSNMQQINTVLDSRDKPRFLLLAERRHQLYAKLARIPGARTAAEV